jgi:uncharacterized protein with FMN-binding domain
VTSKHDPSIPSSGHETQRPAARPSTARGAGASNGRIANSLVAIGSASVLAIYGAGYWRTRAAAERIERASSRRAAPIAASVPAPTTSSIVAPTAEPVTAAPTVAIDREESQAAAPPPAADVVASATPAAPVLASAPKPDAAALLPKDVAANAKAARETEDIVPPQASSSTTTAAAVPSVAPSVMSPAAAVALPSSPAPAAIVTPAASPSSAYKDGTYTGWGTCRHGDIQATVVVASGRITSATISQCLTRYPCSWIEALPPQVVQRQSAEVDYVSGATQSADAFYGAVTDALSKAK